jgi:hypothetical protein
VTALYERKLTPIVSLGVVAKEVANDRRRTAHERPTPLAASTA